MYLDFAAISDYLQLEKWKLGKDRKMFKKHFAGVEPLL